MRYRVLGPLEATDGDGTPISVTADKERQLLAILLANANQNQSADRLIGELWGEQPPATARKTLQTYVSHLRRVVGAELVTTPNGYTLRVDPDTLDSCAFERLVSEGRIELLRGRHRHSGELLGRALALWRGNAYQDVDPEGDVALEAARLDELRVETTEDRSEACLQDGDAGSLVAELEAIVTEHPLRERSWGLLMLALARSQRRADALSVYRRAREQLIEGFGIEPGPALREIHAQILDDEVVPHVASIPAFTTTGDGVEIAYRVQGDGPTDVVFCLEVTMHLEVVWDLAEVRPVLERLSDGRRLIAIQRRGTGLSGRAGDTVLAPPGDCVADIDAVLAQVGCERAAFVGWGHGGQVALEYAAARPERVGRLAVVNSYAKLTATPDYAAGVPPQAIDMLVGMIERVWGKEFPKVGIFDASVASDPELIRRISRFERLTASPHEAAATVRSLADFDIRPVLPDVRCPVLVVFLEQSMTGESTSRYLAEALREAEFVSLPGAFVPTRSDSITLADRLDRFLT